MNEKQIIQESDPQIYYLKDLEKILRVSNRSLLRYIKADKLKATRIGKKYIVTRENLDKFLRGET